MEIDIRAQIKDIPKTNPTGDAPAGLFFGGLYSGLFSEPCCEPCSGRGAPWPDTITQYQAISDDVRVIYINNICNVSRSYVIPIASKSPIKINCSPIYITHIRHHDKHLVTARLKDDGVFSIPTKDIEPVINTEAA